MTIKLTARQIVVITLALASCSTVAKDNKLSEDPTKVVTEIGASYSDEVRVSGSLSLDAVRKLNASISLESEEWRFGGSWLFDIGIVNFNFGKQSFDHGAEKTSYSVGTFMPLSYFGIEPMGWQIFAMGGYSHTEGDIACDLDSNACPIIDMPSTDGWVLVPNATNGGYLGAFALKPLSGNWTLLTAAAYSMGSDDYSGYFAGIGASYQIDKQQKIKLFGATQNSDYGSDQNLGIGYTYQFN